MTPPRRAFEYHADAIHEAHDAYHWYAARSETAADGFWEELRRARLLVTDNPLAWVPYFHGTRVFPLRRYPYGLVYVLRDERVVGLAVCHFKRRPGYWKNRLSI